MHICKKKILYSQQDFSLDFNGESCQNAGGTSLQGKNALNACQ